MDAVRALDARISDIAAEIADLKSLRIESGVEYTDEGGVGDVDDDPEPRSIDELDLRIESGVEYTDEGGVGDVDDDPEPRSIDELDLTI